MRKNRFSFNPIGIVKGGDIVIDKKWTKALSGLEGFSHIIVLCWLGKAKTPKMIVRPKGLTRNTKIGFLATRTPHRANPIGMSVVKLVKRRGNYLMVDDLDAWEGTLILDVKPYTRRDCVQKFRIPGWVKKWDKRETDPLRRYA